MKNKTATTSTLRRILTVIVGIASSGYLLYYLWWRFFYTLNPAARPVSGMVYFAEFFGVINFLLFTWMTRNTKPTRTYRKAPRKLKVDVFVPTYNEDVNILEATLVGCNSISYPHNTYVLDDGHRLEVRKLAQRLGVRYLSRPNNVHAKAGNLNYGLKHSRGEFIAILDADMVPQPDLLDRTLGYFDDKKLAFVQLPQEFYNQDSIQHGKKDWHEQALFFHVIQPGKNHSNSAFWTGSPSVVRRVAMEDVGGIATETITEDIHTTVRLHAKGWRSLFVNEVLAFGIAPQTIHAFLLQRLRWAQGTMQLYRSKDSPFWKKGLTLGQRLSYFASFRAYMEAIQKFILIMTPIAVIMFGLLPIRVDGLTFFIHWLPYFLITVIANKVTGRGYFSLLQTEKYNLLKMVTFLQSFLALIPFKLPFRVTPKSVGADVYKKERAAMRIYMALLGALIGVTISGLLRLRLILAAGLDPSLLAMAIVWAVFNAGIILLAIRDVLTHKHWRKQYRFEVARQGYVLGTGKSYRLVRIEDLSLAGASITSNFPLYGENLSLYFETPNRESVILPVKDLHLRALRGQTQHYGVEFKELNRSERSYLFHFLYVTMPGLLPGRGYKLRTPRPAVKGIKPLQELAPVVS